jgi:virginiamycin B lyase
MKPMFLFLAAATILSAQTLIEYLIPTAGSQPYAITAGPDGALWFTEVTSGKIGRISTAGVITEYAPTPAQGALNRPRSITTGPDGALWIAAVGNVVRLTTSGVFTLYPVASPNSNIQSITSGPDGALWFTSSVFNIGRITTSGAITFFPLPNPGASPGNIVTGPDQALWIGDPNTDHIDRMTSFGAVTQFSPPSGGPTGPNDFTVGPDGALWAVSGGDIASVSTAGVYTSIFPLNAHAAQSLVSGPDGALWFIEWQANEITQMTTSGSFTRFTLPTASSEPWSTVAGPDGAMWITERSANKIARMTVPALPTGPTILAGGIVNAAGYAQVNGAGSPVAPGSLVAIFTSPLPGAQAANFTTANLPPSLGNVSVTFNGVTAPMIAVSPAGQYPYVSAQVPFEALGPGQTSATVPVVITVNNIPSPTVEASIVASQPGIFTIPATGQGNAILTFLNPATNTPAIAAPPGSGITYPTAPIPRGTGGFFYVTGLGAMTPAVPDGSGTCPSPDGICNANAKPIVMVGGVTAPVAFAGQAPGFPGVFQVNITIPQGAPTGSNISLVVKSADGSLTSNTATIAVQ